MGIKEKFKHITPGAKACVATLLWGGVMGITLTLSSCARMGAPDGGWYDETPPRVVSASPADRGVGVKSGKVAINFSEFIKIENATEKVVVSPPQMEQPKIKATGKRIVVELLDSLKPNTTYTVDFSDAISDNNEGNPLGNYTYSFSTGPKIDTLECSGYVLNAEDLEPIKGILVGLYPADGKSGNGDPFVRVARSDSRGRFVIRGIAPGTYTVGAVQDVDGDYRFSQRAETMAFSHQEITPTFFGDYRQDTIWADELHIKDIIRVPYTHFMPDNIVLRSFQHMLTERHFVKYDRTEADRFTLFFTAPICADSTMRFSQPEAKQLLPVLRLLNAPEGMVAETEAWSVVEPTLRGDTVTYWLRDTALVNRDTLQLEMTTLITDTMGVLQLTTDTLEILAKTSYAKRMKQLELQREDWQKQVAKRIKAREKYVARMKEDDPQPMEVDTVMPPQRLVPKYDVKATMEPDGQIGISFPYPMQRVDTAKVHLYVEQDSLWFRAPFVMRQTDSLATCRNWEIVSEWLPGAEYSLEIDTLAFEDIYGHTSEPYKSGLKVNGLEAYASLFVNVAYTPHDSVAPAQQILVQTLDKAGNVQRTSVVENGTAEFYYITPGTYYLRAVIDRNGNGQWDTGDYYADLQPEEVYYNPEPVECKAKWDITKSWNLNAKPLYEQKPSAITHQKADKAKKILNRNAQRAKDKGIPMPDRAM